MAFTSGPIPLIGISTAPFANNAINTTLNVGLSSVLGETVSKEVGLDLTAGSNILKSQVTPFLTASVSQALNQQVSQSLRGAGPLGPALSQIAAQATTALGQNILGGLFGATSGSWNGVSDPTQQWPGAGGNESEANYSGKAYTTGTGGPDVVFSIQPANAGPQSFGSGAFDTSLAFTSMPLNNYTDNLPNSTSKAFDPAFTAKAQSMGFNYGNGYGDFKTNFGGDYGFTV